MDDWNKEIWNQRAQEQKEDLKTKSIREDINLSLSDKEYSILKLRAYKAGFKDVSQLLVSFVGDLTGCFTNGSDEESKADEWYERAFGMSGYYSNFRYHLFNNDFSLEDMKDMIEDEDWFEDTYQDYLAENSHMTNETKDICLATLKEIVEKGEELQLIA